MDRETVFNRDGVSVERSVELDDGGLMTCELLNASKRHA